MGFYGKGSGGYYYTLFPDESNPRGYYRRRRRKKKDLEDLIVLFWKHRGKEDYISIENVFTEWNDRRLRLNQISSSTYDRNIRAFKRHYSRIAKTNIKDVTPQFVSDFLEEEIAYKKLSARSFATLKGLTKGFLRRAQTRGLIDFSVNQMLLDLDLSDSCFRRNEKIDKDDVFTEEEFTALASYLKEHPDIWNLGIMLILSSGPRVGEFVTLK